MRFLALAFLLLVAGFVTAYPQSVAVEALERAKKVSLLNSTRAEVRNIFWDFEPDLSDTPGNSDTFTKDDISIEVHYSAGGCSDEEEIWNVPSGNATKIVITADDEPKSIDNFGIKLAGLSKERAYSDLPESYIYFKQDKTFSVEVNEKEVQKIVLLPRGKGRGQRLCDSEEAKTFAGKTWFGDSKLEERHAATDCFVASVESLTLSSDKLQFTGDKEVSIEVEVDNRNNDVITYLFNISGGRIIGEGPKVTWSLKGLSKGTYTVTAGVDDGCGVCGKTVTKAVTIY